MTSAHRRGTVAAMNLRRVLGVPAAAVLLVVGLSGCGGGAGSAGDWQMMRIGPGMMGYVPNGGGAPVESISQARHQAQAFADHLGLTVGEVMRFTNNYYAELDEKDGTPATEVLVDPQTGATFLEYGPAMMWNTAYGMMSGFVPAGAAGMMGNGSGMMGGGGMMQGGGMMGGAGDPTYTPAPAGQKPTVSSVQAAETAQRWLQRFGTGLAPGAPEPFPGYYTLHVLRDGKITGMLSVNAYTGAVWDHWWHGTFLGMEEE